MLTVNITNFRKNCFDLISKTIHFNQSYTISKKEGSAVLLSEEEYRGLLATAEILAEPGLKEKILSAASAPDSDFVSADEIIW